MYKTQVAAILNHCFSDIYYNKNKCRSDKLAKIIMINLYYLLPVADISSIFRLWNR